MVRKSIAEQVFGVKSPIDVFGPKGKKRRKCPKTVYKSVWLKYIGKKYSGKCYVGCGRSITVDDFELGHNKPASKGGTCNVNNLRPICRTCNRGMGNRMTIEGFKKKYFGKGKKKTTKRKKRRKKTSTYDILKPTKGW